MSPDVISMNHIHRIFNDERRTKNQEHGFTLVELLVVMLIIVILSGITISVSKYAGWRARQAKAEIEIQKIRSALDEYRAVYGEYPIVGDPNHYPTVFEPDAETSSNMPPMYRRVDLVNTQASLPDVTFDTINWNEEGMQGVECLRLSKGTVRVDYRLTYPLKIKPESEGRAPFMDFPKVTVCSFVWRNVDDSHKGDINIYDKDYKIIGQRQYMRGDPVNRFLAVDPISGRQWRYECTNGTTYTLTNWFW